MRPFPGIPETILVNVDNALAAGGGEGGEVSGPVAEIG